MQVRYEDGDEEELDWVELEATLLLKKSINKIWVWRVHCNQKQSSWGGDRKIIIEGQQPLKASKGLLFFMVPMEIFQLLQGFHTFNVFFNTKVMHIWVGLKFLCFFIGTYIFSFPITGGGGEKSVWHLSGWWSPYILLMSYFINIIPKTCHWVATILVQWCDEGRCIQLGCFFSNFRFLSST